MRPSKGSLIPSIGYNTTLHMHIEDCSSCRTGRRTTSGFLLCTGQYTQNVLVSAVRLMCEVGRWENGGGMLM